MTFIQNLNIPIKYASFDRNLIDQKCFNFLEIICLKSLLLYF
jgi:hypothetical protein